MAQNNRAYTYEDAGFNGFMRRTLNSNINNGSLSQMARNSTTMSSLNFDNLQVSGSLGDTLEIGRILLNGADGQIDVRDEDSSDVVVRIGEINA